MSRDQSRHVCPGVCANNVEVNRSLMAMRYTAPRLCHSLSMRSQNVISIAAPLPENRTPSCQELVELSDNPNPERIYASSIKDLTVRIQMRSLTRLTDTSRRSGIRLYN